MGEEKQKNGKEKNCRTFVVEITQDRPKRDGRSKKKKQRSKRNRQKRSAERTIVKKQTRSRGKIKRGENSEEPHPPSPAESLRPMPYT